MSIQVYPDSTLVDIVADKFAYQQEYTDIHASDCPEAHRHNWWRTSLFTNEEDRTSTGRYTCGECMERTTVTVNLPPTDEIEDCDSPAPAIKQHDGYCSDDR
jgi:hypothetical protein